MDSLIHPPLPSVTQVEGMTKGKVDFDTPFRDLGFFGAPFRSTVLLQPTSNALVSLIDWVSH